MNRLNFRLLGGLLGALIVLGVGSYALHAFQVDRHAGAYLREAQRAQDDGRPLDAVRHFRRYVKLAPHDAEGLALFGTQLAELGQLEPAYLMLDQALRREPQREEWRRKLVETAIELQRFADARANLEQHLLKQNPKDGSLLNQLGRCQVALGKDEQAAETFQKSVQAEPNRLESYILLAGLYKTRFQEIKEADAWIDRMVDANTNDPHAFLARGQWRLAGNSTRLAESDAGTQTSPERSDNATNLAAAQADARRALELAPDDLEVLLFAARVTAIGGQNAEARALGQRASDSHPDAAGPYILLSTIESAEHNTAAAIEWLRRGVKAVPRDTDIRWSLAQLLVDTGHATEAGQEIERLREAGYPSARLRFLEGRIAVSGESWREAIRTLETVRPELSSWPDLAQQTDFWLGRCYERIGNPDQQLIALRRAVEANPSFIPSRLGLAGALLATGRIQEAQEHYQFVASLPQAPAIAHLRLAQLLVVDTFRRDPSQRDWPSVERRLEQLDRAKLETAPVTLLRAEVLVAQEKHGEAAALLEKARRAHSDQIDLLAAQVVLAEHMKDHALADQLLKRAADEIKDPVACRLLKGRTLASRDRAQAKTVLADIWTSSESLADADRARLARGLAELSIPIENYDFSFDLAKFAAKSDPNELEIQELLLDVAVRSERVEALDEILQDIRRIEGEGALWHYGRAAKTVLQSRKQASMPVAALDELNKARTLRPGWSQPVLLTAEIYDRQGDASRAADAYLEAISLGERNSQAVSRTVQLLFEQNRFVEADQIVRRMQEPNSLFTGDLTRLAAEASLHLEEFDRATDLTQSFAAESDQLQDHLWAGQMLELLGRYDEAESRLRRAIEIDPASPSSHIALVRVLVHAKRFDEAEATLPEIEKHVDADQKDIAIAQCYELLGKKVVAETHYRKALERMPNDASTVRRVSEFLIKNRKSDEAEPQLRKIVQGEIPASPSDQAWARRSLAMLLGTRGDKAGLAESMKLLEENRPPGKEVAADIRAQAVILASQPSAKSRQQAVSALEKLVADERTASPEDRFLLAELLRREGNLTRAAEELRLVLSQKPDEPRFVSSYVEVLLERGENSEAALWMGRLSELTAEELDTADLESRVLFASDQLDRAAEVLTNFASQSTGTTDSSVGDGTDPRLWAGDRLTRFAVRLRETGRPDAAASMGDKAELLFKELLQDRPQSELKVAVLRARLGLIDQALESLNSPSERPTPEAIEEITVAVMTCPVSTPEHLTRLQSILDETLSQQVQATAVQAVSADLLGWRGEHHAAEARYRTLLKNNDKDIRVLNNLALVLALGEKRFDESLSLIDRAIAVAGPQSALLDTRGLIQLAAGRTEGAQQDFQRALAQGSAADRYLHLAAAQWQSRDKESAQQTFRKAEKLGLTWSELHPLERPLLAGLRSEFR